MKHLISLCFICLLFSLSGYGQKVVEIKANQSMSITGKGQGQDALINPYTAEKSIARVKNIGENPFFVRIELNGREITNVEVGVNKIKEFMLDKGFVLYLDSNLDGKAKVNFKKFKEKTYD